MTSLDLQFALYQNKRAVIEAIQIWARRKLNDESAAWPVWQKIRQEGIDANPYVDKAFENTLRKF